MTAADAGGWTAGKHFLQAGSLTVLCRSMAIKRVDESTIL